MSTLFYCKYFFLAPITNTTNGSHFKNFENIKINSSVSPILKNLSEIFPRQNMFDSFESCSYFYPTAQADDKVFQVHVCMFVCASVATLPHVAKTA